MGTVATMTSERAFSALPNATSRWYVQRHPWQGEHHGQPAGATNVRARVRSFDMAQYPW